MRKHWDKLKYSIVHFTGAPIENLGVIIPGTVILTALVALVVALIIFIATGGYNGQISSIKTNGFDGISAALTNGTVYILYGRVVSSIIKMLLGAQFIIMMIAFFLNATKVKRIIMIVDLVLTGVFIVTIIGIVQIYTGKIVFSDEQAIRVANMIDGTNKESAKTLLIVLSIVAIATIVSFLILILITESRWMLEYGIISGLISMVAIPLIVLLIENIIPLIAGIVALAILGLILWFVFSSLAGGESSSNVSSNHTVDTHEKPQKESKKIESDKNTEVISLGFSGFKLWKVHGIMHDYIARDNGLAQAEVCTLDDLRKGKFHLYDKSNGKEIKESSIPWQKQ